MEAGGLEAGERGGGGTRRGWRRVKDGEGSHGGRALRVPSGVSTIAGHTSERRGKLRTLPH